MQLATSLVFLRCSQLASFCRTAETYGGRKLESKRHSFKLRESRNITRRFSTNRTKTLKHSLKVSYYFPITLHSIFMFRLDKSTTKIRREIPASNFPTYLLCFFLMTRIANESQLTAESGKGFQNFSSQVTITSRDLHVNVVYWFLPKINSLLQAEVAPISPME